MQYTSALYQSHLACTSLQFSAPEAKQWTVIFVICLCSAFHYRLNSALHNFNVLVLSFSAVHQSLGCAVYYSQLACTPLHYSAPEAKQCTVLLFFRTPLKCTRS